MNLKPIRIRYSDFPKHSSIPLVIKNLCEGYLWNKWFIVFDAFFFYNKKIREFELILPYYQFQTAYQMIPVRVRKEAGTTNVQMILAKLDRGRMKIQDIKKWKV